MFCLNFAPLKYFLHKIRINGEGQNLSVSYWQKNYSQNSTPPTRKSSEAKSELKKSSEKLRIFLKFWFRF